LNRKRIDCLRFVFKVAHEHPPRLPYAPKFDGQPPTAKQVTLRRHKKKPAHVFCWINFAQRDRIWEYLKLYWITVHLPSPYRAFATTPSCLMAAIESSVRRESSTPSADILASTNE
jgi:hypothetical protein